MKHWKTGNDYEIFQVLSRRSNSYLIIKDTQGILLDTGKDTSYKQLRRNIEMLQSSIKAIDFLILTHTHFDHCQNVAKIKEQEHCRIIVGKAEEAFCNAGHTPLPDGTNIFTSAISTIGKKLNQRRFSYDAFNPDIVVTNNYSLKEYNFNVNIIGTPGHSPGSICVIVDNEIALVGDAMFGVFYNSVFPPYAVDIDQTVRSWKILLDTRCTMFLPGHGSVISRNLLEKQYQKYARKLNLF